MNKWMENVSKFPDHRLVHIGPNVCKMCGPTRRRSNSQIMCAGCIHLYIFTSNNGIFKSGKPTICERHALTESNPATVTRRAIVGPVIHGYHSMTPSLHEIKFVCAETLTSTCRNDQLLPFHCCRSRLKI